VENIGETQMLLEEENWKEDAEEADIEEARTT